MCVPLFEFMTSCHHLLEPGVSMYFYMSSLGGESCKPIEPPKTPGYGMKMLPAIEGLEEKFKGDAQKPAGEVSDEMMLVKGSTD